MERNTTQRRAIHQAFENAGRPLGPAEVFGFARATAPGLGIATVYRTIKRLLNDLWLVPVSLPGEALRYELAGLRHHHHFRCRECGRVYPVDGCCLTQLEQMTPRGFLLQGHEVVLYGQCIECTH